MLNNKIRFDVKNLNEFIDNDQFVSILRTMTLNERSGMNKELTWLKNRKKENGIIDAKAIIASESGRNVGWLYFSREDSKACWSYEFKANMGVLVQIYVVPELRRAGLARQLMIKARRLAGSRPLCVIPWDENAEGFFRKNLDLNLKSLLQWVNLSI